MSGTERLLGWFDSGALVRPDAGVPNTVALAQAIAALCGAPGARLNTSAQRIERAVGPSDHIVFVMVDGFGMNLVERLRPASFFRSHLALELQAVFPSSTAPALTSLATGCFPAEHAVPAWFTYLPDDDLIATILPYIERFSHRPLVELGIDVRRALPLPSRLPQYVHEPRCCLPARISGSIYSSFFSGGGVQSPYRHLSAAVDAVVARIESARSPTYSYLYVPFVDAAEHTHGPLAKQARRVLTRIERDIARLSERLGGRARIIVSADHGLAHVEPPAVHEIKDGDPLLELLRQPPSGEPRVPSFYARDGAAKAFHSAFGQRFGDTHVLLTIDEVDALRLLGPGPLTPETRRRLGDFMAVSATADAIVYKPDNPMLGFHGGLLPDEMRVPLIIA